MSRNYEKLDMTSDCGIYAIISTSGKRYIGSAKRRAKRWQEHLRDLRKGTHHSPALQRAFDKYGEAALQFVHLEDVARPVDLITREQAHIDAHDFAQLYNVAKDAKSPMRGRAHKLTTRAKMSQLAVERMTPEAREHLSEVRKRKGLAPTQAVLEASSAKRRGKPLSPAHKEKLRAALEGKARPASVGRRIAEVKANRITAANTSGVVGVSRHAGGKWKACVHLAGKSRYLGLFATVEAAAAAIDAAKAVPCVGDSGNIQQTFK